MKTRTWSDDDLIQAVATSYSLAQVMRQLNLAISGGSYTSMQTHIKRLNLDTSHFGGKAGKNRFGKNKDKQLEDILTIGSPYQSSEIRRFLIRAGLKANRCERPACGVSIWHGQELTCHLHHVNGDKTDNRLENLLMLCPNCHSLTDNYGGKNRK